MGGGCSEAESSSTTINSELEGEEVSSSVRSGTFAASGSLPAFFPRAPLVGELGRVGIVGLKVGDASLY